jgi:RNA polymerase sigma factor (sigma-70 family)
MAKKVSTKKKVQKKQAGVQAKKPVIARKAALAKKRVKSEKQRLAEAHQLITENYETGKRLAWSFLNKWRVRIEEDEVLSITGAALCEAANRFKSELGVNFKTFLFYYLRGMLLKEITKRVRDQRMRTPFIPSLAAANDDARGVALENLLPMQLELSDEYHTPEALLEKKQRAVLCREATAGLDELEQQILERYFADNQSVVEIAKSLGYCRCHISRVKSKALETLSDNLRVLNPQEHSAAEHSLILRKKTNYRGVRGRRRLGQERAAA